MITHICDFLDKTAEKFSEKTAFVEGEKNISYSNFNNFSKKLASKILSYNIINEPILIILPKGIDCLISFFGVARSGNFYTLLDDKNPKERTIKISETLKPKLLITSKNIDVSFLELPIVYCEDFSNLKINENLLKQARDRHIDTNLLYVFFTSGSTGTPKGVSIKHKSVIDYTFWVCKTFNVTNDEILANQAPFYFDNSILDIFSSVKMGATLHIIPTNLFAFPIKVVEYIKNNNISMIFWVPSVLIYFANAKAVDSKKLASIKKVLFCGEIMPNKQLNIWRKELKNAIFANLYGPTEVTDVCSYYICNRDFKDDEILPIGISCKNTELLVFDENLKLITKENVGIRGELCVRGTSLSAGYYADQQKTSQSFIQNPLHNNYDDKIYKTGDIVAYNEFGELLCFGRADNQIKIMGHRVELGEIENIINSHSDILNSACVFINDEILCFYEAKTELNFKNFLKDKLPSYMIPKKFIKIGNFDFNQNGKIDRRKLKDRCI